MRRVGFLSDLICLVVTTGGSESRIGGRGVKDRRFGDEFLPHGAALFAASVMMSMRCTCALCPAVSFLLLLPFSIDLTGVGSHEP